MSRPIDLALHSKMFQEMVFDHNVSVIYVRIMTTVYNQESNVKWVQDISVNFPVI